MKKTTRLQPLTAPELDRLRDLYASAPLASTERTASIDAALKGKGWIDIVPNDYDGKPDAVLAPAALRADNGRAVLYNESGSVHECWRAKVGAA